MVSLPPVPPRRRIQFMLTPLVDVMFLLLIFFMLTADTKLYSLLQIFAQTASADGAEAGAPASSPELLVSIGRDVVRLNGVPMAPAELASALAGYRESGITRATLVPAQGAEAQDVVTVLELFEAAAFDQARLIAVPAAVQ